MNLEDIINHIRKNALNFVEQGPNNDFNFWLKLISIFYNYILKRFGIPEKILKKLRDYIFKDEQTKKILLKELEEFFDSIEVIDVRNIRPIDIIHLRTLTTHCIYSDGFRKEKGAYQIFTEDNKKSLIKKELENEEYYEFKVAFFDKELDLYYYLESSSLTPSLIEKLKSKIDIFYKEQDNIKGFFSSDNKPKDLNEILNIPGFNKGKVSLLRCGSSTDQIEKIIKADNTIIDPNILRLKNIKTETLLDKEREFIKSGSIDKILPWNIQSKILLLIDWSESMKNPNRIEAINSNLEILCNFIRNSYPNDELLLYLFSKSIRNIESKYIGGIPFEEGTYIVKAIFEIFKEIKMKQILVEKCIIISDGIFNDYNEINKAIELINKNKICFTFFLLDPTEEIFEGYKLKYQHDNSELISNLLEGVKQTTYKFIKEVNGDIIYIKKQEFLPVLQTSYYDLYKSIISDHLNRKYSERKILK